jgi:hypothetical protein
MWTDDITTLLTPVATLGQDLFFSTKAAPAFLNSGSCLVVIETPGRDPEYVQNQDTPRFIFPGAQVAAVAVDYATARAKAQAAFDALVGHHNATINGTFYRGIKAIQQPFDGGLNARGQSTCKFNIMGDKRP